MGLVEFTYDKEKYKEVIKEFPYEDEVDAIFIVNGKLLGGEYYKGRIFGDNCSIYEFFQDILIGLCFLLDEGKSTREPYFKKDVEQEMEYYGFDVKNIDLAYYTKLGFGYNVYIFELDKNKDELVIHYYNELLSTRKAIEEWEMGKIDDTIEIERFGDGYMMTKKKEFYIKNRDYVRVPLKNFAKEIIKISEDYFEFIKSIEIARGYYDWFYGKDEHCLEQRIKNVKKFYRKRYGEEL